MCVSVLLSMCVCVCACVCVCVCVMNLPTKLFCFKCVVLCSYYVVLYQTFLTCRLQSDAWSTQ